MEDQCGISLKVKLLSSKQMMSVQFRHSTPKNVLMLELVDKTDLKSVDFGRVGSSPTRDTIYATLGTFFYRPDDLRKVWLR